MKNGLNILLDSYWANGGWKDGINYKRFEKIFKYKIID